MAWVNWSPWEMPYESALGWVSTSAVWYWWALMKALSWAFGTAQAMAWMRVLVFAWAKMSKWACA